MIELASVDVTGCIIPVTTSGFVILELPEWPDRLVFPVFRRRDLLLEGMVSLGERWVGVTSITRHKEFFAMLRMYAAYFAARPCCVVMDLLRQPSGELEGYAVTGELGAEPPPPERTMEKGSLMTLDEIQKRLANIATLACTPTFDTADWDAANSERDHLYIEVLESIANGSCEDPRAAAKEALKAQDIEIKHR